MKLRIYSDGTPKGTHVINADTDEEIKNITLLHIRLTPHDLIAQVEVLELNEKGMPILSFENENEILKNTMQAQVEDLRITTEYLNQTAESEGLKYEHAVSRYPEFQRVLEEYKKHYNG